MISAQETENLVLVIEDLKALEFFFGEVYQALPIQ
jgi:hypothetical protein